MASTKQLPIGIDNFKKLIDNIRPPSDCCVTACGFPRRAFSQVFDAAIAGECGRLEDESNN